MILGPSGCAPAFQEISDAADAVELAQAKAHNREPRQIIVNAATRGASLPKDCVVWNFENIGSQVKQDDLVYWHDRASEIWDFSKSNLPKYFPMIACSAKYVPVGFHESMKRFTMRPDAERDIDVCFFGMMNERRTQFKTDLDAIGVKTHFSSRLFGAERDAILSRSKLALSLQYYEGGVYPALRVLHYIANGVPFVTETHVDEMVGLHYPLSTMADAIKSFVGLPNLDMITIHSELIPLLTFPEPKAEIQ